VSNYDKNFSSLQLRVELSQLDGLSRNDEQRERESQDRAH